MDDRQIELERLIIKLGKSLDRDLKDYKKLIGYRDIQISHIERSAKMRVHMESLEKDILALNND